MSVTRVDQLSDEEKGRFNEWADRWIDMGLRTGPADRERFEASVRDCYRFAGIDWPDVVVWVPSPLVMAFAAPAAALAIELIEAERRGTLSVPRRSRFSRGAVGGAVDGAVGGAVRDAVGGAVGDAVDGAVGGDEITRAVLDVIRRGWANHFGGQLWVSGWHWGGAWTSFFREVCKLELKGDLWNRARAYEGTMESACWWWPHRRFVMVCERPVEIHRELTDPAVERGWGSHQLHREDGPAVVWPDGWGVYAWHGVRVPADVIEQPELVDARRIVGEENVEVRRAMLEKVGYDRLLDAAERVQQDDYGTLWRIELDDDTRGPALLVEKACPSTDRRYVERVDPGVSSAREAIAWQCGMAEADYDAGRLVQS